MLTDPALVENTSNYLPSNMQYISEYVMFYCHITEFGVATEGKRPGDLCSQTTANPGSRQTDTGGRQLEENYAGNRNSHLH